MWAFKGTYDKKKENNFGKTYRDLYNVVPSYKMVPLTFHPLVAGGHHPGANDLCQMVLARKLRNYIYVNRSDEKQTEHFSLW